MLTSTTNVASRKSRLFSFFFTIIFGNLTIMQIQGLALGVVHSGTNGNPIPGPLKEPLQADMIQLPDYPAEINETPNSG